MPRISRDAYFIEMARLAARRGTCSRRQVGCVLVDSMHHVMATGFNGNPVGMPHCIETPCEGAGLESGSGLVKCQAVHAEQNALLQCSDVGRIATCYTTASPCVLCLRMLLNTSCYRIVFVEEYPHADSKAMWLSAGREWCHFKETHEIP